METETTIPLVQVRFPGALHPRTGSRVSVKVAGHKVREVIDALEEQFPGLRFNLCTETGELRPYVNIFLDRENIRYLQGLDTPLHAGATLHILPSVAGGRHS